ncbi:hypothetical protein F5X99DRAFT_278220 [Biscogniauxia marginata]|nr:hypothetical protein F5X99DRAFT_278220 [Biscogniauxia marginata]
MTGTPILSFQDPGNVAGRGWPQLMRSRTLANSAVEFIESRPEKAFGSDVAEMMGSETPQFAPELDQFVASSEFPEEYVFKESEQRMTRFKETLAGFCKIIEERKLDKKLGIELKRPGDYKMQDVIQVAQELQSKHKNSSEARGYLGRIRRCFRQVIEHRGTLHNLLNFVPNDTYGSPICGGFTVILTAIDRAEDLREEVYAALAEIPRQLQRTSTLIDIHKQSRKLKSAADSVFIAIFEVLESIIKELAKSIKRKTVSITLKGEQYGIKITTAIEDLGKVVKAFNEEARVCDSKRLGRVEEHTVGTRLTVEDMSMQVDEFYEQYKRDRNTFSQSIEYQNRCLEELPSMVNKFYRFLASNPSFDAKNGMLDQSHATKMKILNECTPTELADASSSSAEQSRAALIEGRQALVRKWIQESRLANTDPLKDVDDCLGNMNTMRLGEKDKVRWIIESDEVRGWLTSPNSSTLVFDVETPPQDLVNLMTTASVFLFNSISTTAGFPTLGYMSNFRTVDDPDQLDSGPQALVESLVAQLVLYIAERRTSIDLEFLKKKKLKHKSRGTLAKLISLFGRLLEKLCEDDEGNVVFIIIDSISHLQGTMEEATETVLQLLDTIDQVDSVVKLLLTDAGSPLMMEVQDRQLPVLYVPDSVDGGKQDLNVELLEGDTSLSIEEFRSSLRKSDKDGDSFDSDDSGDYDSVYEDNYVIDA